MKMFLALGLFDEIIYLGNGDFPSERFAKDTEQHLIPVMNDLWKNILQRKHKIKTLEKLCVEAIRKSLFPVTADKIRKAGIEGVHFDLVARKNLAEEVMRIVEENKLL